MKQLTVRGVDGPLHTALKREAQRRGVSVNRCILSLLKQSLGLYENLPEQEFHDLDHLAGTWSKEQTVEFDEHLQNQRRIDPGLWS